MVNIFEPQNVLLKKHIHAIYIYEKGEEEVSYTAYPSTYTAVGLFRNAALSYSDGHFTIKNSDRPNHFAASPNLLFQPVHLRYLQMVDEIAINFNPLGFSTFVHSGFASEDNGFVFSNWDIYLDKLFNAVFASSTATDRLNRIEEFLLERYKQLADEAPLLKAIEILTDVSNDFKIEEIAEIAGIHYKHFYRSFVKYVGCSPAHFRKIIKFRKSIASKLTRGNTTRLVEICYDGEYTDQSYFTKQFRELTGENPKNFFKDISAFGNNKVVFKFH